MLHRIKVVITEQKTEAERFNNPPSPKNKTGYKGVDYKVIKYRTPYYTATLSTSEGRVHLGTFRTAEDAACAYDRAAWHRWGDEAWLNFPELVDHKSTSETLEISSHHFGTRVSSENDKGNL